MPSFSVRFLVPILALGSGFALTACQQVQAPPPVVVQAPPPASVRAELLSVSNPAAPFAAQLWSGMPTHPRIGDALNLGLRSDVDGYVSLFVVTASGGTGRLLDNRRVGAGERVEYPGRHGSIDVKLMPPAGVESFVLIASRRPLGILLPGDVRRAGSIASLALTSQELADRIRGATAVQPAEDWNAAILDVPTSF
ncbi:DUF4384 domain-containing protein (plasmid) [Azospirillum sp. TSA2s]|uniref:DUF4384 domain-containing protein n=1 Tax=Azospirillum sp. TSA2s TaxID=709810 RepID=UPI0010A9961F|nr:DUF4384 domain-containing protein [Azospirillum sp. TSA2s]QCG93086.1 DUF4384 domain-containing protein [Azospirillum sp. TSA2s]